MIDVIVFAFMVLDFATGLTKAVFLNDYSSTKMREGLFHKSGLILCVALGWLVDYAQGYLDLGFAAPVHAAICVYICLMECGSILENLCVISPELMPNKLAVIFGGALPTIHLDTPKEEGEQDGKEDTADHQ